MTKNFKMNWPVIQYAQQGAAMEAPAEEANSTNIADETNPIAAIQAAAQGDQSQLETAVQTIMELAQTEGGIEAIKEQVDENTGKFIDMVLERLSSQVASNRRGGVAGYLDYLRCGGRTKKSSGKSSTKNGKKC